MTNTIQERPRNELYEQWLPSASARPHEVWHDRLGIVRDAIQPWAYELDNLVPGTPQYRAVTVAIEHLAAEVKRLEIEIAHCSTVQSPMKTIHSRLVETRLESVRKATKIFTLLMSRRSHLPWSE